MLKYINTLRYLKLQQVFARLYYKLYKPRLLHGNLPNIRRSHHEIVEICRKASSMNAPNNFTFLNQPGQVSRPDDWNDPCRNKLWLYNLHYFDDLTADGAERRLDWHRQLIRRWINDNPPVNGNGWEPYSISLRVVNWIKWDLHYSALDAAAVHSLALQLRWLRRRLENHLLGNHLIANAKALLIGGLYFDGNEADEWLVSAKKLLVRELNEQILPDGGHFERSPMYHLIILEDLLDIINFCRAYDSAIPAEWLSKVNKMLDWASIMQHPDGDIPFFNDTAFGIAAKPDLLHKYAKRLSITHAPELNDDAWLNSSGYLRLTRGDAMLFFDAAPIGPDYLPAHAHADTLSLELSLFGQRLFVNSGTSLYEKSVERRRQRGTYAHNTAVLDKCDSSEVWGGFRVARRARVRNIIFRQEKGIVQAEHDGYQRLPGKPVHRRLLQFKTGNLVVTDTITGAGEHFVQIVWYLHPSVKVMNTGGSWQDGFLLKFIANDKSHEVKLTVQGPRVVELEDSVWHPEFGREVSNQRLLCTFHGNLPVEISTQLQW